MAGQPIRRARIERFHDITEDPATLEEIGCRIAEGESLKDICKAWVVPAGEMLMWLMRDEKRYEVYRRALEVVAHGYVGEALGIADDAEVETVGLAKLKIDTRFRLAKYHAPGLYADKDVGGGGGGITVVVNRGSTEPPAGGEAIEMRVEDGGRTLIIGE